MLGEPKRPSRFGCWSRTSSRRPLRRAPRLWSRLLGAAFRPRSATSLRKLFSWRPPRLGWGNSNRPESGLSIPTNTRRLALRVLRSGGCRWCAVVCACVDRVTSLVAIEPVGFCCKRHGGEAVTVSLCYRRCSVAPGRLSSTGRSGGSGPGNRRAFTTTV